MTVRATFAFNNLGGGPATGLRVRFALPEGLTYLVGTARIDDEPLDETSGLPALLSSGGVDIGDVEPGSERRIAVAYTVAATIEDRATIALQAAIASFEIPVIGSNVVRLTVRSRPLLANPATSVAIVPTRDPSPGSEASVSARVHNAGDSSAHGVIVLLPTPAHTRFVPGSALVDGKDFDVGKRREPFGYANPPVIAHFLGPGATLVVEYRATIDSPLPDNTRIEARGWVASSETPEFELSPAALTVRSSVAFDGEGTHLEIAAEDDVVPGQRIRIALRAENLGTNAAANASAAIGLPNGLAYSPGSSRLNGQPLADEAQQNGTFALGDVPALGAAEVSLEAIVLGPAPNGRTLPIEGLLRWNGGERQFNRLLTVRSQPLFLPGRNYVRPIGPPVLEPGDEAAAVVHVANDGTTSAKDAQLRILADAGLQHVRVYEDGAERSLVHEAVELGSLEPNAARTLVVKATIASPIADASELRLRSTLVPGEGPEIDLGTVARFVQSRPRFTRAQSRIDVRSSEPLRPDRIVDLAVRIVNEGTDTARDARVRLQMPPEMRLESADGATLDGNTLLFGELEAGAAGEAVVRMRLARFVPRGTQLAVDGWVTGVGIVPLVLEPATIATFAEPAFAAGASLSAQPLDSVDAGAELSYTLALRNTGDGTASRLVARVVPPSNAVYVPGSTTVNDVTLLDVGGGSVLWSAGLMLSDIGPGVEVIVRWRTIVNTPLPVGTLVETRADVVWDGERSCVIAAPPVRVRSAPAFPVSVLGLPFSLAGAIAGARPHADAAPAPAAAARHEVGAPESAERQAAPASFPEPSSAQPHVEAEAESLPAAEADSLPAAEAESPGEPFAAAAAAGDASAPAGGTEPTLILNLEGAKLERTVRFLQEADFGGLITHVFVLRALLPDGIDGARDGVAQPLAMLHEALRATLDRLFVRLRLPRYALTAKDLEDREARTAIVEVLQALQGISGSPDPPEPRGLRIAGRIVRSALPSQLSRLEDAPLGSPAPWLALSHLLGDSVPGDEELGAQVRAYRDALIVALTNVEPLPLAEFHRVLTGKANAALDAALRSLVATLSERVAVAR